VDVRKGKKKCKTFVTDRLYFLAGVNVAMKRLVPCLVAMLAAMVAASHGFAAGLRAGIDMEYGTTSSSFGLDSFPFFSIPPQNNVSNDFVLSGDLELLVVRRWPVEIGVEARGSFAFSDWFLGTTTVYDSLGNPNPYDGIHVNSEWWALAGLGTLHVHLGPALVLDGAFGYGPYGYTNVSYYDDYGIVAGPVTQGDSIFPPNAWGLDWSAGLSVRLFLVSVGVEAGMTGPDFVAGLGIGFLL